MEVSFDELLIRSDLHFKEFEHRVTKYLRTIVSTCSFKNGHEQITSLLSVPTNPVAEKDGLTKTRKLRFKRNRLFSKSLYLPSTTSMNEALKGQRRPSAPEIKSFVRSYYHRIGSITLYSKMQSKNGLLHIIAPLPIQYVLWRRRRKEIFVNTSIDSHQEERSIIRMMENCSWHPWSFMRF